MALVVKEASTFEMNPLLPSSRQKMEAISFQNAKASSSTIWHSKTEVSKWYTDCSENTMHKNHHFKKEIHVHLDPLFIWNMQNN
jgi:hypothetical protein